MKNRKRVEKKTILALGLLALLFFTGCGQWNTEAVISGTPAEGETKEPVQEEAETEATKEPEEQKEPVIVLNESEIAKIARQILSGMTLEEKIGQMFVVNFEQLDKSKGSYYEHTKLTEYMEKALKRYGVGGVIFFSRNIETREQTSSFIKDLQENSKVPLFISVDEEGGEVARIANNSNMRTTRFPSMEEIGANGDEEYAYQMGLTIGTEIKELGFNLNFAPVADVKTNEDNREIGSRAFGEDGRLVAKMVKQVVKGLQEAGVSATLKHFPGHGSVSEDTHQGAVNVDSDLNQLRKVEFVPFQAGIKAGADLIMVSHLSISKVTGSTEPASLSSLVMKQMLREELGFEGVIVTDAMDMKSITEHYSSAKAAVKSIHAGADIILMPEDFRNAYQAVLEAAKEEKISKEQIDESVQRILALKIRRGLISLDTELLAPDENNQ